jgi:hypothetical protein
MFPLEPLGIPAPSTLAQPTKGWLKLRGMRSFKDRRETYALMMDVESNNNISVNFYETAWCNFPEDNHLHTCHHKNLKSHKYSICFNTSKDF